MNDWTMWRRQFSSLILRLGGLCLLAVCGSASSETVNCIPITSLPATITIPGTYCLTRNLNTNMTSGNAIDIQTDNVIIDLNGYKLGGLAAGDATHANGIHTLNHKNITLRNGTIRGFLRGVYLRDGSSGHDTYGGHLLEDLRFDGNTWIALQTEGRGNLIRRNQVVDTGGSTVAVFAWGIIASGPGARILDNDVDATFSGTFDAHGIYVDFANATIIQGNRVTETTSAGGGDTYGIYNSSSTGVTIEANLVSNASTTGTTGIEVPDIQSLCANNRVQGFTTGILICTNAGGNFSL